MTAAASATATGPLASAATAATAVAVVAGRARAATAGLALGALRVALPRVIAAVLALAAADAVGLLSDWMQNSTITQNEFDRDPRVAFISYSDFGSATTAKLSGRYQPTPALAPPAQAALWEMEANWLLTMNPPDHTRLRGLVQKAFTPRAVAGMAGAAMAWRSPRG